MMQQTPSIATRARIAFNVLRGIPPVRAVTRKQSPFFWPAWREGRPQWQITDFNSYVTDGFEANSLIYSAIMYKVRSLSSAPLRAYVGEESKVEILPVNHPLAKLAKRPNPYQSCQEFMGINTVYLNIAGNSFVMLDRGKKGDIPIAMYPLRPDRVMIIPSGRTLKGYVYVPEGKSVQDGVPILPEDMMHVRLPNPNDPLEGMGYGLSPIAAMSRSADVDNAVTNYLKIFFDRGAAPNLYLKFETSLDDDVIGRIRQRFMEMYGGYQNWVGPAIMDQGGSIESFGQSFKEMGFEAIDDRNESRVLGPFGVPGVLIGTRLGLNRAINANAEELRKSFWQDTMLPELSWHETEYQYHLEGKSGEFVAFDTSGVPALSKDKNALVTSFSALVSSGIPKNTAAKFLEIEFEDELQDGDIAYISTSLVPLGGAAPALPAEGETTGVTEEAPVAEAVEAATSLNLNGAQVQAVLSIVQSVSNGSISRNSAISMLQTMFGISEAQANAMMQASEQVEGSKAVIPYDAKQLATLAYAEEGSPWEEALWRVSKEDKAYEREMLLVLQGLTSAINALADKETNVTVVLSDQPTTEK